MKKSARGKNTPSMLSCRAFIKNSVLAAGALSTIGTLPAKAAAKPKSLPLKVAGYKFDRTEALIDGRVPIEGCSITFEESGIGDINQNVFSGAQTFDVTGIGLQEIEETRALMGEDFWPYGIAPNRKALEALFLYSYEQGLANKKLVIEELFHPSSLGFEED